MVGDDGGGGGGDGTTAGQWTMDNGQRMDKGGYHRMAYDQGRARLLLRAAHVGRSPTT